MSRQTTGICLITDDECTDWKESHKASMCSNSSTSGNVCHVLNGIPLLDALDLSAFGDSTICCQKKSNVVHEEPLKDSLSLSHWVKCTREKADRLLELPASVCE